MFVLPIIERELRAALQRKQYLKSRFLFACIATSFAIILLAVTGSSSSQQTGREVFLLLFFIACALVFAQTVRLTADLLASERRNNTLGLLFLAGLRPMEILASKVSSGAVMSLSQLLGFLPAFAIAFLTGGFSIQSFTAAVIYLPNLLLFSLSVTILGSILRDDSNAAMSAGLCIAALICLTPIVVDALTQPSGKPAGTVYSWTLLSPLYGYWLVLETMQSNSLTGYWINQTATLGWSIVVFAITGRILRRSWQREFEYPTTAAELHQQSLPRWLRGCITRRHSVNSEYKTKGTLAGNSFSSGSVLPSGMSPAVWFLIRDRSPVFAAWTITAVAAISIIAGAIYLPLIRHIPHLMLAVFGVLACCVATAARRLAHQLHNGNLEQLLTTPLRPSELLEAQRAAILLQFKGVIRVLVAVELVLFVVGLRQYRTQFPALFVFFVVWPTMAAWLWLVFDRGIVTSIRLALTTGRPTYAAVRAIVSAPVIGLGFLFLVYSRYLAFGGMSGAFPRGTILESVVLLAFVFFPVLVMAFDQRPLLQMALLKQELRTLVQNPLFQLRNSRDTFRKLLSGSIG